MAQSIQSQLDWFGDNLKDARTRIAELEAALRPFVNAARDMHNHDDAIVWNSMNHTITEGDFRTALKVLENQK